jgi:dipeptidyl aminopeptidase/acylaminoacyl peptidase
VSPDGRHVAVAGAGQGSPRSHVLVVDLAGRSSRRVSDEPASGVAWSPNGDRLAVTVQDRLLVLDVGGSPPPRTLLQLSRRDLSHPAWSPDGARIAVTATVHRPHSD